VEKTTFVEYLLRIVDSTPSGGSRMIRKETKPKLQHRLNRIAGQVAGLQKMVEEDRYCADILTQIAAVRSALDAVGMAVLTEHVTGCMVGRGTETEHPEAKQKTPEELEEELRTLLARLLA
jgi:CsoR family transcriptional regulator, copper-sensing transcriptional repressor